MSRQRASGFLTLLALVLSATVAQATVLTMQGEVSATNNASPPPAGMNTYGPLGNGSTIVSEYGDFVAGPTQTNVPTADFGPPPYWYNFSYGNNGEGYTPNVAVAKQVIYPTTGGGLNTTTATRSQTSYGNLPFVAYPAAGTTVGGKWYWTFTADPGFKVKLISTDIIRFNSTTLPATVNVYAGNTPLALGSQLFSSGTLNVANVGQTVSPNITGQALTLEFVLPQGDALFNWAADNIVIAQVPEPSTLLIGVPALLAAAWMRVRRR